VKECRNSEPNESETASVNANIFNAERVDGISDRSFSEMDGPCEMDQSSGGTEHGSEQMDTGAEDQVRQQVRELLQSNECKHAAIKVMEHFSEQPGELRNYNRLKRSSGEFTWEPLADHERRTICYTGFVVTITMMGRTIHGPRVDNFCVSCRRCTSSGMLAPKWRLHDCRAELHLDLVVS